jgi:hypothetical protein
MIPKSMSSTRIGDGNRFSDKIMREPTMLGVHMREIKLIGL